MTLFLCVTIAVMLLNVLLLYLNAEKASNMFKTRYPDLVVPKRYWAESALIYIKFALISICPILNIALAYVFMVNSDELCEETVWDLYRKAKEKETV